MSDLTEENLKASLSALTAAVTELTEPAQAIVTSDMTSEAVQAITQALNLLAAGAAKVIALVVMSGGSPDQAMVTIDAMWASIADVITLIKRPT